MIVYMGITDAAGSTLVIVGTTRKTAENNLYKLWRKTVYVGFQPDVKDFETLKEWNGARVAAIPTDSAIVWE